ncbi:MAG: ankyrin repeat domain-containing protein [Rhodanobacteraceae bacterium]|nr:ankyrin repeat domain-containing protein [Rhodanobacteraceae bacterium]
MTNLAKFFRACRTGNIKVIRECLGDGLDPNSRDEDFLTGLIWAGRKGKIESAQVLLEHGAELEAGDKRCRTALFHATVFNHLEFVEYLVARGANVNPVDMHGCTPLDIALIESPTQMAVTLKKLGGYPKWRAT